jgi:hypothetical protein
MRKVLFILTLLVGFALAVAGFVLAPPIGPTSSPAISNPHVPFAAGLFTIGIIVIFFSAVVYELYPSKRT